MKAILCRNYCPPDRLQWEETAKPAPADDEVLLRVRAAAVNPLDWHFVRGEPRPGRLAFGLFHPKEIRVGRDVAGEIEAVGKSVTRLHAGDAVFGVCVGAFAEYACAKETKVAAKPAVVTFEQAASTPIAGLTALQGLRDDGKVRSGQRVLINGAAGGVGTFAVQIAKALGTEVTGVCSGRNTELVRSLGADRVLDYAREDFTRGKEKYDVIFDLVGNHSFVACRRALTAEGRFVGAAGPGPEHRRPQHWLRGLAPGMILSASGKQKMLFCFAKIGSEDLGVLASMMESGKLRAVIDRTYPLNDAGQALAYVEEGHARGKVVVTVGGASQASS